MAIIYEINPPRVTGEPDDDPESRISAQLLRVDEISPLCDGIHVTDSVLGTRRVPAVLMARRIKERHQSLQVTASMRVRDRNMQRIEELVEEYASAGIDGVLVLMGDPSQDGRADLGLVPSSVAGSLVRSRYEKKIAFYLSLPANPNFSKIRKKIDAGPAGFVTQVIHSADQVEQICRRLKPQGFRIIPCILLPSEKNARSAEFLGLDWSPYRSDPAGFVTRIHDMAGDVLLTSPNDFAAAKDTLQRTKYSASG